MSENVLNRIIEKKFKRTAQVIGVGEPTDPMIAAGPGVPVVEDPAEPIEEEPITEVSNLPGFEIAIKRGVDKAKKLISSSGGDVVVLAACSEILVKLSEAQGNIKALKT